MKGAETYLQYLGRNRNLIKKYTVKHTALFPIHSEYQQNYKVLTNNMTTNMIYLYRKNYNTETKNTGLKIRLSLTTAQCTEIQYSCF